MPQPPLWANAANTPRGLSIHVEADPTAPEDPITVSIWTTMCDGCVGDRHTAQLVGVEADFLETLINAAVEAFHYGEGRMVPLAIHRVHSEAKAHRKRHER